LYNFMKRNCETHDINDIIQYHKLHYTKTPIKRHKKRRRSADTSEDWLQFANRVIKHLRRKHMSFQDILDHVNIQPLLSWIYFTMVLDGQVDRVPDLFFNAPALLISERQLWDAYFNQNTAITEFIHVFGWRIRRIRSYRSRKRTK
jgi:hypothetical protein